ncbi:MAG: hypothetical protein IJ746_06190 [Ruminococcus sp.]|nr:hypothetical protein [Ruminococcus sp.]
MRALRIICLAAAVLLAGCAEVPEEVRDRADNGQRGTVGTEERVDISRINEGTEDVAALLRERGYDEKFKLLRDISPRPVEELYDLTLVPCEGLESFYPEVYASLFGRDFYKDSGSDSLDSLPRWSETGGGAGFCYDDFTDVSPGVVYSGAALTGEEGANPGYLSISSGGFLYYQREDDSLSAPVDPSALPELFQKYIVDAAPLPEESFELQGGGSLTLAEAAERTDRRLAELLGPLGTGQDYRVNCILPYRYSTGKYELYMNIEKAYRGVGFFDQLLTDYEPGERRSKNMCYDAYWEDDSDICSLSAPFGLDRIVSAKPITDGLITLPQALDIMNDFFAPDIQFLVLDLRLVYFCDYDASDVEALEAKDRDQAAMTPEESRDLDCPELTPGREFHAYPVWLMELESPRRAENGAYYNAFDQDSVMVDARTGEVMTFIDRQAVR